MRLEFTAATGHPQPSRLAIAGTGEWAVHQAGATIAADIEVPPGKRAVQLACDAPRPPAPGDPRVLVYKVVNLTMTELP